MAQKTDSKEMESFYKELESRSMDALWRSQGQGQTLAVFKGSGPTIIDGVKVDWTAGDFLAVPPWAWHEHVNEGDEPVVMFSSSDTPVFEALALYHEMPYPDNGGHQKVVADYEERFGDSRGG